MNKNDLMDAIAEKADLTKKAAGEALNAVLDSIMDSLQAGEDVQIIGFGAFNVGHRTERKGRNPASGKEMIIPASKYVKFTAGKKLKEAVNFETSEAKE